MKLDPRIQRLLFHLLLAIFVANAANKLFVVDLDYEAEHQVYAKIFEGEGVAPDQYRMLPLLPLSLLCDHLPFNHAVLIYNAIFGFLVFELLWMLLGRRPTQRKYMWNIGLGVLYIYLQYTGWRPDTMGLLLVCCLVALGMRLLPRGPVQWIAVLGGIVALAFCRADIALVYGIFAMLYLRPPWAIRVIWLAVAPGTQALLQFVIYPEAVYYSQTVMIWDNLRLYYLLRSPATYLILAAGLAFWQGIRAKVQDTWEKYAYFYLLFAGYLILVLFIGRINEYRLFLPFLPLYLLMVNGNRSNAGRQPIEKTRTV